MSIVAEHYQGKTADTHFALYREPFLRLQPTRISQSSIRSQSMSSVRRNHCQEHASSAWMHLRPAGTRSTSAFAPSLHEQLLLIVTRNDRLNRSANVRVHRDAAKNLNSHNQLFTRLRCNALLSSSTSLRDSCIS